MSSSLRVSLVQAASTLDPAENRELLAKTAAEVPDGTDLMVWPEAFARDFGKAGSDVSGAAETVWGADAGDGPFAGAVAQLAAERRATVVAGMFETSDDPGRPWNTLAVAGPDGERASYRKIHLYDSFGYRESDRLSPGGTTPVTVEVGGFTLGLMTCYDLRFPEHARMLVDAGSEVLVLPAAWLAGPGKLHHWRTLLTARAIENTVFVVAAAQPAPRYTGHSLALDPMGRVLGEAGDDAGRVDVVLERSVLAEARETNPSLANRRL
ncbi:carbon-nitrogen hydrolase family protein [Nocardioides sp. CFH 31398]|uniref:carbon-nitrogen hydrolase family protein n=1 Tax=Nocardioides sp. CFH 31398 TaxID=2919579 RepID=UPI001F06BEF3|nr:carbon-nitrogen hydrolase family protein [Nocardioides sp. CFH 31398]MCH1865565.1 carbon-nitrogen hydrolase family protein [Nocardioides sp. CFH 31398]